MVQDFEVGRTLAGGCGGMLLHSQKLQEDDAEERKKDQEED